MMEKKRKANAHDALNFGRGGLIEKVKPLPSVFAFALSILRIRSHRFRRGNIDRPTYQIRSLCISAKQELRSRCGFTLASCSGLIVNSGLWSIREAFVR